MIKVFARIFFSSTLLITLMVMNPSCSAPSTLSDSGSQEATPDKKEIGDCQFSSDCKSCGDICAEAVCKKIDCSDDGDCRCKWKCVSGACYDPQKAPCQSNSDCKDEKLWKCDSGKCIDGGCQKDSDCKDSNKPSCNIQKNICEKKPCLNDSDCHDSSKPICDKTKGDCIVDSGVDIGGDCSQKNCLKNLLCYEEKSTKTCLKSCDPFNGADCPKAQVCIRQPGAKIQGICLPPGQGLAQGKDCSGGKECQRHLKCVYGGSGESCRKPCLGSSGCDTTKEHCSDYFGEKYCLPKESPCGPGRACLGADDGSQQCQNGLCITSLCPKSRTCSLKDKCQKNGRCVPRSCPTDKCPSLFKCQNGRCVETNEGKRCGVGQPIKADQCGNKFICSRVGYVRVCVKECLTNGCPTGFDCKGNIDKKQVCIQVCPSSRKCKYPAYACRQLKRSPTGNYCAPIGQPAGKDIFQTCDNQNTCLPDLRCVRGYGIKGYCAKGCTSSADCSGINNSACLNYLGVQACWSKAKCNTYFRACTVDSTLGRCYRSSSILFCRPN